MLVDYTIKKGDTLWAIGREAGLNWRYIHAINRNKIENPNKIYVGQVISVPNKNLMYWLDLTADLIQIMCPYKISILISLLRFVLQQGYFKKEDVAKFLIQNGISAIFVAKVEILYQQIGKQGFTVIYDWWSRFWDFGINRIIGSS
jgi:LysM repeat protein